MKIGRRKEGKQKHWHGGPSEKRERAVSFSGDEVQIYLEDAESVGVEK